LEGKKHEKKHHSFRNGCDERILLHSVWPEGRFQRQRDRILWQRRFQRQRSIRKQRGLIHFGFMDEQNLCSGGAGSEKKITGAASAAPAVF